jgi:hypothetical protein
MNNEADIRVKEVAEFISRDMNKIGMEKLPAVSEIHSMDELKKVLIEKITVMLDHEYDKLINALYLIDLDEVKLYELFSGKNREVIPSVLVDMIFERQIQKIHFRKKYREGEI